MFPASWILTVALLQEAALAPPAEMVDEARRLAQAGQYEEAVREFRSLLAYAPKDPLMNYYLGITLFKLERYEPATVYLERAIELDAPFPEPFLWLARAALKLEVPERALKVLKRGLEKFPRNEALLELQSTVASETSRP